MGRIMKNRSETAISKFIEGYNCAQSVFYSFCDELQLDQELALKIACGFGAGMGRKQEVCGAVTGGIMVIGAKVGRGSKDDKAVTEATYQKTRDFIDRFSKLNGAVTCRDLLGGCELMTEEGQRHFKDNDLLNKVCKPCIQSTVEILAKVVSSPDR